MVSRHSCDCPRGKFKCHHVAALLLWANKNVSCTDGPCQWKVSTCKILSILLRTRGHPILQCEMTLFELLLCGNGVVAVTCIRHQAKHLFFYYTLIY